MQKESLLGQRRPLLASMNVIEMIKGASGFLPEELTGGLKATVPTPG
jgi:hypothetical protein